MAECNATVVGAIETALQLNEKCPWSGLHGAPGFGLHNPMVKLDEPPSSTLVFLVSLSSHQRFPWPAKASQRRTATVGLLHRPTHSHTGSAAPSGRLRTNTAQRDLSWPRRAISCHRRQGGLIPVLVPQRHHNGGTGGGYAGRSLRVALWV